MLILCSAVNIVSMILKQRNSSAHIKLREIRTGEKLRKDSNGGITEDSRCRLLSGRIDIMKEEGDYKSINSCDNCDKTCEGN